MALPLTVFSDISSHSFNDTNAHIHSLIKAVHTRTSNWFAQSVLSTHHLRKMGYLILVEGSGNSEWMVCMMFQLLTCWILNFDETEIENVAENVYHWWYLYWLQVGFRHWDKKKRQWRKIVLGCCMSVMYVVHMYLVHEILLSGQNDYRICWKIFRTTLLCVVQVDLNLALIWWTKLLYTMCIVQALYRVQSSWERSEHLSVFRLLRISLLSFLFPLRVRYRLVFSSWELI